MASDYRFSQPFLLRALGTVLVGVGAVVATLAVAVALAGWSVSALSVAMVLAVLAVGGAGFLLARRTPVVRFDDDGYRVRLVRGAGVKQARWRDVEDAVTARVRGLPCVVLRLRDGRTTTLPSGVLDAAPDVFVADLRGHLDRGHGYRRIN